MEEKIYDGSQAVTKEEAKQILRGKNVKISNKNVDSFVSLKDINKIYPNGAQAVYNFNLDINKHDFIVLVGPSGCGKSTTLRMIAGLEDITSGYLYIDKILANYLESKNRDISMVFQSYALYPQMTVYDNIGFPLKVRKFTKRQIDVQGASYSKVIDLLTKNLIKVRKGLSEVEHIKDKFKHKLHYLERYLGCNELAARILIDNANEICDPFTLRIYGQLDILNNLINRTRASLKAAHVVLNENNDIVDDGRLYSKNALEAKELRILSSLIRDEKERVCKALVNAYDPRGDKRISSIDKLVKSLEISAESAKILANNRIMFALNNEDAIAALYRELQDKLNVILQNPDAEVSTTDFSAESIAEVKLLQDALYFYDLGMNHFKDLHARVLSNDFEGVTPAVVSILTKNPAFHADETQPKLDALLARCNEVVSSRTVELASKGYEVNDKFELSINGEPVYKQEKLTKDEAREKIFNAANVLDLGPYLDRRPKELSGGQMQRVALGRAIVRNAQLFLMDEPLSNLDAKLRVAMRSEIVRLHESIGATTIYVTHDQTEAMTMATKIVIMSKGWVQQVGTPQEVYENPKNLFVATFIGSPAMNILDGYLEGNVLTLKDGYSIKLSDDFIERHNEFYKRKIVECEEMINTLNNEVEVRCYQIVQEIFGLVKNYTANYPVIMDLLNQILDLAKTLNKKSRDDLVGAVAQVIEFASESDKYTDYVKQTLIILNNLLVNYETINNGDIEKIHSAQAFKKESTAKASSDMVYRGRKHEFVWTKISKKFKQKALARRAPKVSIEDPKGYLLGLKAAYEDALVNGHNVKLGIRPENIFLAKDNIRINATDSFAATVDVVELMGSESLVHTSFNGIDFLAKITSGTKVSAHERLDFVMDLDKIHIFDVNSGETII